MRLLLIGFGVVGRSLVRLLDERRGELYRRYGIAPRLVGVVDGGGAAVSESGLETAELLAAKERGGTVAGYAGHGMTDVDIERLIADTDGDVVVEATPSNLKAPATAMRHMQAALRHGRHVVTVNKAPLAVGMPALLELASYNNVQLRFSGTVGAGTPMLALASECARGDDILGVRAILNGTTNFILSRMSQQGEEFDAALAEAVRLGYAETDPSNDIDGIDTATKMVIIANHVLGRRARFGDVEVSGIRGLPRSRIESAAARGHTVKLIGEIGDGLRVSPQEVPAGGPLDVPGSLNAMTLTLRAGGDVTLVGRGAGGVETATAIVRDLLDIWQTVGNRA